VIATQRRRYEMLLPVLKKTPPVKVEFHI